MVGKKIFQIALLALILATPALAVNVFTIDAAGNNTFSGTISLVCNSAPSTSCQVSGDWAAMRSGCSVSCPDDDVRVRCEVGSAQIGSRELEGLNTSFGFIDLNNITFYTSDFQPGGDADFTCIFTD